MDGRGTVPQDFHWSSPNFHSVQAKVLDPRLLTMVQSLAVQPELWDHGARGNGDRPGAGIEGTAGTGDHTGVSNWAIMGREDPPGDGSTLGKVNTEGQAGSLEKQGSVGQAEAGIWERGTGTSETLGPADR